MLTRETIIDALALVDADEYEFSCLALRAAGTDADVEVYTALFSPYGYAHRTAWLGGWLGEDDPAAQPLSEPGDTAYPSRERKHAWRRTALAFVLAMADAGDFHV